MIEFFGKSDVGKVRKNNEDFFLNKKIEKDEFLFIVADGMGGHQAGDIASSLGTHTFAKTYKKLRLSGSTIPQALKASLNAANGVILDKATKEPDKKGMGTTFSALVIKGNRGHIIHIGDSRIYLIRNNKIDRLTTDHTFVEKMVEEGRLSEKEARVHPHRNILYFSLGARESLTPQVLENFTIESKDIFLMCSDGLNTMVEDSVIKEYSLRYSSEKAVNELIELANDHGGTDNITIQIIHFGKRSTDDATEPINVSELRTQKSNYLWMSLAVLMLALLLFMVFF